MAKQPNATNLPIDRDDLEMAQDDIKAAQEELHEILEQMKEVLDNGTAIEPKLFQEANNLR